MKKIAIPVALLIGASAIFLPTGSNAQSHVKTNKQYIVLKMPHEVMATNTYVPWGLPEVAIEINKSKKKSPPQCKSKEVPVQSISKKKPKVLNM